MNSLEFHKQVKGKIEIVSRVPLTSREDLSLAYTPGVAEPCRDIAAHPERVYDYTRKWNMVAVVTDGSAILGLGNIGPEAGLPVMEGKCLLFKELAGVDAFPIALKTQDVDEIVRTIEIISPMFGGINLEDIAAPRCFEIERRLNERLPIAVMHDDQHATAMVVLSAVYNALKIVNKEIVQIKVVISGAGAAGIATANLLLAAGVQHVLIADSKGLLYDGRSDLNVEKQDIAKKTNREKQVGTLADGMRGADVFIGVSVAGLVTRDMVASMAYQPIVIAMANPVPEIMPDEAKAGGVAVMATGRSDFPNQVNNVLVFPGVFRGLLDIRAKQITVPMKLAVARALADMVTNPTAEKIIPDPLDRQVSIVVSEAIKKFV